MKLLASIKQLLRDYSPNKPWDPRLSVLYDQTGVWCEEVGIPLSEQIPSDTLQNLREKKLSSTEIFEDPTRQCLLTSYRVERGSLLPYRSIQGHLLSHKCSSLNAPSLQTLGLTLWAQSALQILLPNLESVGGDIHLNAASELNLERLSFCGGTLWGGALQQAHLPRLKKVSGDLDLTSAKTVELPQLQQVGEESGSLFIKSAKEASLTELRRVEGHLIAENALRMDCPQLTRIRGHLCAPACQTLTAPLLKNTQSLVCGALDLHLPQLQTVETLLAPHARRVCLPNLKKFRGDLQAPQAQEIHTPNLQQVHGDLFCPHAVVVNFTKLGTVLGQIHLPNLKLDKKTRLPIPPEKTPIGIWGGQIWRKLQSLQEFPPKTFA